MVGWMINFVTIESNRKSHLAPKFNVAAFVFENAEVTAADSNIALCTIRSQINRKSSGRET